MLVQGCIYPNNATLNELQRLMMPRFANRLAFQIAPFKETSYAEIIFRTPDILIGMQPWRGVDKEPQSNPVNYNHWGVYCRLSPGYWGEQDRITEELLTRGASPHSLCGEPIDLFEIVANIQELLMERRYNRVEFNIWQALVYGNYEARNMDGVVVQEATFNINKVTIKWPWSDPENSTPLMDIRCVKLLERGTSTSFGSCATMYMNQVTMNCMLRNRNPWDIGKHGVSACCEPFTMDRINEILAANQLPNIMVYEGGYYDDARNFHTYIPDGYAIIVGCRPNNEAIARYWLTRNAVDCVGSTGIGSGFAQMIQDSCTWGDVPRKIKMFDLHNGGVGIHYPQAVVAIKTGCNYASVCS